MSNMRNHPIEIIEMDAGILIRDYDIRPDSGGAGQWHGGVGQLLTVEFLNDGSKVYARGMERFRFPAWSVAGGAPAAPFRSVFNIGRADQRELGKINEVAVNAGDTITMMMPGTGGYGDPLARDAALVAADVRHGFVSPEQARQVYGVALDGSGGVDEAATASLRRAARRSAEDFAFGPERAAWEAVFDDATMNELVAKLYRLPRSVRQQKRRWIFSRAIGDLDAARGRRWSEVLHDPAAARRRLREAMDAVFGDASKERLS